MIGREWEGGIMKISEPIFIEKVKRLGYMATGKLEGYGRIKEYGFSEEEAKERFFEACERAGRMGHMRKRHLRHRIQYA
jgi:hypothetical protein